jgi:hypothetical protein
MKKIKKLGLLAILIAHFSNMNAQTLNWNTLDSTKHISNVNFGLNYSLSFGLSYGYKLNTKLPIVLNVITSTASGINLFDDFKTEIGGQVRLFNKSNFAGSVSINGVYRKGQTNLVRLQNFGSNMEAVVGFYKPKWFVAAEFGFDKAIVTHFKHSQKYRDEIYADVVDGWYEPATGGNFNYGFQAGKSFNRADITINFGKVISQGFKTYPLVPFYFNLGYNFRF